MSIFPAFFIEAPSTASGDRPPLDRTDFSDALLKKKSIGLQSLPVKIPRFFRGP